MLIPEAVFFFLLLLLSAYFSSIETALTSQTKLSIKHLVASKGVKEDKFRGWLENPNRLLTTILVANNAVTTLASVIATLVALHLAALYQWPEKITLAAVTSLALSVIIIFGEIIPKVFAKQNSARVALLFIGPLEWMAGLINPLLKVLLWISNLVIRLSGGSAADHVPFLTAEELRALINVGEEEGALKEDQKQMIHSIFEFSSLTVREAMIPRTEMVCVDIGLPTEQLIDRVIETGYSRLPVYRDNVDNIVGLLYTKDLLSLLKHRELIIVQDLIRQPYFVPEGTKVNDVLKEFQRGKIHMALVVDEYGGTAGLITLEDLIEEIVGEIRDEYDAPEMFIQRLEDGSALVDARLNIQEANQDLGMELPISEDGYTLAGFINALAGGVPRVGQKFRYDNTSLEVVNADRKRVQKVKITVQAKVLPSAGKKTAKFSASFPKGMGPKAAAAPPKNSGPRKKRQVK